MNDKTGNTVTIKWQFQDQKPIDEMEGYNNFDLKTWRQTSNDFRGGVTTAVSKPVEAGLLKMITDGKDVILRADIHNDGIEEKFETKYLLSHLGNKAKTEGRKFVIAIEGINNDNPTSRKGLELINSGKSEAVLVADFFKSFDKNHPLHEFYKPFIDDFKAQADAQGAKFSNDEQVKKFLQQPAMSAQVTNNVMQTIISSLGNNGTNNMTSTGTAYHGRHEEIRAARSKGAIFVPLPYEDKGAATFYSVIAENNKEVFIKETNGNQERLSAEQFNIEYTTRRSGVWANLIAGQDGKTGYLKQFEQNGKPPLILAVIGESHLYSNSNNTRMKGIDEMLEERGVKETSISVGYSQAPKDTYIGAGFSTDHSIQMATPSKPSGKGK